MTSFKVYASTSKLSLYICLPQPPCGTVKNKKSHFDLLYRSRRKPGGMFIPTKKDFVNMVLFLKYFINPVGEVVVDRLRILMASGFHVLLKNTCGMEL